MRKFVNKFLATTLAAVLLAAANLPAMAADTPLWIFKVNPKVKTVTLLF